MEAPLEYGHTSPELRFLLYGLTLGLSYLDTLKRKFAFSADSMRQCQRLGLDPFCCRSQLNEPRATLGMKPINGHRKGYATSMKDKVLSVIRRKST